PVSAADFEHPAASHGRRAHPHQGGHRTGAGGMGLLLRESGIRYGVVRVILHKYPSRSPPYCDRVHLVTRCIVRYQRQATKGNCLLRPPGLERAALRIEEMLMNYSALVILSCAALALAADSKRPASQPQGSADRLALPKEPLRKLASVTWDLESHKLV